MAARFSGLHNERVLMKTYLVTGLLVGVVGGTHERPGLDVGEAE